MNDGSIAKKVIQGLGNIAEETGKEVLKQSEEVLHAVITGKELIGDVKTMTDQEMAQKKAEDERKKQEEINKLRAQMGQGRPVEQEMAQIRREEEQEEKQKQQQEQQRPKQEQNYAVEMPGNPKKSAAKQQGRHKKKSSMPDPSQMSQTNEMNGGGKID